MVVGVEHDVGELGRELGAIAESRSGPAAQTPVGAAGSAIAKRFEPVGQVAEVGVVGQPQRDHRAVDATG